MSKTKPAPKPKKPRRAPPKFQTLPVKFGEPLEIRASADEPKWISATKHDLHVHVHDPESRFALFKGDPHPTLITARVLVTEPAGRASHVIVTTTRPRAARKAPNV